MHLPVEVRIAPDAARLAASAAAWIASCLNLAIQQRGVARIALSGGSTPRQTYQLLAQQSGVDWGRVVWFWGDERCVPPGHVQSNYRMARLALLDPLGVPDQRIIRIHGELPPAEAARRYAAALAQTVDAGQSLPRFDVLLLGLGEDGHTASLFPGTPAVDESQAWTATVSAPDGMPRVSLTLPVINAARRVAFLAYGSAKARLIANLLDNETQASRLPAARVQPSDGRLIWLVDQAAVQYWSFVSASKGLPQLYADRETH